MEKLNLQDFRINNYINWYKKLSTDVFLLDLKKERHKRYSTISFILKIHNLKYPNPRNEKNSNECFERAKKLETEIEEIEQYTTNAGKDLYFIPEISEWVEFDSYRNTGLETLISFVTEKIERSAAPEIEIYKDELARKNAETLEYYTYLINGIPILKKAVENSKFWVFDFANEVSNIDYCIWLQSKTTPNNALSTKPEKNKKLEWNGTQKEFSELVKALAITVFSGIPETEIISKFAPLISINDKPFNTNRHTSNVNDLQDACTLIKRFKNGLDSYIKRVSNNKK